jgi:hypothetical protein
MRKSIFTSASQMDATQVSSRIIARSGAALQLVGRYEPRQEIRYFHESRSRRYCVGLISIQQIRSVLSNPALILGPELQLSGNLIGG